MDTPERQDFPKPHIGADQTLDRMAEKRSDIAWIEERLRDKNSRFLLFVDLALAVDSEGKGSQTKLRWLTGDQIKNLSADLNDSFLLGCKEDGHAVFTASLSEAQAKAVPGGLDSLKPLVDLRPLAMQGALPPEDLSLAGMGRALAAWHGMSKCCGRCGGYTRVRDAGWRRKCRACGQEFYPRSDPAVIVLITDGKRCLLGHHKRYAHKFYSTLAGFVEPGEDFESCVRREMKEETGIKVGEVTYMASQPWPFPHLMMVGCWAQALTTDVTLEEDELHDARWFTPKEVKQMIAGKHPEGFAVPGPHSIAYALIKSFVDQST
jgi:NAD+ diphosphatase